MLSFHSWFRFICLFCPQIISVSMVFHHEAFHPATSWRQNLRMHFKLYLHEKFHVLGCCGFFWPNVTWRNYVMVLLWKKRNCPKICQRRYFLTFLMFLYFRISVLTFYIKLLYVVRVLGVKHLYIWNAGTNTKYYRNKLIFDNTCTT